MGAAGGHMPHPFNLANSTFSVDTGEDLLKFFELAIQSIKEEKASLKIDGSNASFKLVTREDGTKEFVGDRASLHPIDIEGITAKNASERFVPGWHPAPGNTSEIKGEGEGEWKPHGMIQTYTNLLKIMNEALLSKNKEENIIPELQVLGMYDNPTLFFNTEYVAGQTNVLNYDHDFLAIHNLSQIYEKKSTKGYRPGIERPMEIDPKTKKLKPIKDFATEVKLDDDRKGALKRLVEKAGLVAKRHNFKIYGDVPIEFKTKDKKRGTTKINLAPALRQEITIVWDKDMVGVEPRAEETYDLKYLLKKAINPKEQTIVLSDPVKTVKADSKEVYLAFVNEMDAGGVKTISYSDYLYNPLGLSLIHI